MVKFLLASHGKMASGMKMSLNILLGNSDNVTVYDAYVDDSNITEVFEQYLDTSEIPDPDLLIRTSGEQRLSNYLLWQLAYSEFYFCDTLWPDFDSRALDQAIIAYQSRDRRFGGVK